MLIYRGNAGIKPADSLVLMRNVSRFFEIKAAALPGWGVSVT